MRVIVCIPTYNEIENLARLARRILEVEPRADVLVIDDNSPDGTGEAAERLARETGRVHVVHRAGKLGLGTAQIAGLRWGLEHGYDRIVTMDADFSHSPERIPSLVDATERADLSLGSRYIPGGGVANWPWMRVLLSAGVNRLAKTMLGLTANDCSGGFRCFRADSLRQLDLEAVHSKGYSIQEEMLWRCQQSGWRVAEVPITFVDRQEGTSKVGLHEVFGTFWMLLKLMFAPRPRRMRRGGG